MNRNQAEKGVKLKQNMEKQYAEYDKKYAEYETYMKNMEINMK